MVPVVVTLIGNDQSGLVDAVASVVARHGGNWDRSHLAELAGMFAGIVLVTIADENAAALLDDLNAIDSQGLLSITAELAGGQEAAAGSTYVTLDLTGQDHPGIVHEISSLLAKRGVNIDELETVVAPAPQGGNLFIAHAVLELPAGLDADQLASAIEAVTDDLMVDISETGMAHLPT